MKKLKLPRRTCHMVVDATRLNPYITCPKEPIGDGNFCQEHQDYMDRAEIEIRKWLSKEDDRGKDGDSVDGTDVEPGEGVQRRLPGVP